MSSTLLPLLSHKNNSSASASAASASASGPVAGASTDGSPEKRPPQGPLSNDEYRGIEQWLDSEGNLQSITPKDGTSQHKKDTKSKSAERKEILETASDAIRTVLEPTLERICEFATSIEVHNEEKDLALDEQKKTTKKLKTRQNLEKFNELQKKLGEQQTSISTHQQKIAELRQNILETSKKFDFKLSTSVAHGVIANNINDCGQVFFDKTMMSVLNQHGDVSTIHEQIFVVIAITKKILALDEYKKIKTTHVHLMIAIQITDDASLCEALGLRGALSGPVEDVDQNNAAHYAAKHDRIETLEWLRVTKYSLLKKKNKIKQKPSDVAATAAATWFSDVARVRLFPRFS